MKDLQEKKNKMKPPRENRMKTTTKNLYTKLEFSPDDISCHFLCF